MTTAEELQEKLGYYTGVMVNGQIAQVRVYDNYFQIQTPNMLTSLQHRYILDHEIVGGDTFRVKTNHGNYDFKFLIIADL